MSCPSNLLKLILLIGCLLTFSTSCLRAETPTTGTRFIDKTMVVWATLGQSQQSNSIITLENPPSEFDSLVFGEIQPGKWMVGSDYFRRTERNQEASAVETASPDELLQLAIVYQGNRATLFRNGEIYASHEMAGGPIAFSTDSHVLIGQHHSDTIGAPGFIGTVDDARLYDRALTQSELRSLRPNQAFGPKPLAWWTFEDATDSQGTFAKGQLVGQASIESGKLILQGGFFAVNCEPFPTRESEDWPIYHLHARPSEGLARPFDPNGCLYQDGVYHLMYIYQDRSLPREGHSWGHYTSTNLIDWTHQKPALKPAPGDPDVGIFSGNAFLGENGQPMLCWFGVDAGVCVATAEDSKLLDWKKHPANPVIPIPEQGNTTFGKSAGDGKYFVWDPYMWFQDGTYYCLLGGNALANGKDTLYLMKSEDLTTWKPLHPFYEHPDATWTVPGEDCSCPDFFQLGDKHVLLCISHSVGARCYVGDFNGEQFHPEQHVRMNWPGGNLFAPESLEDEKGRRIFWSWITDPRLITTQLATGSGVMSLPRTLSLSETNRLQIAPVAELETLRKRHQPLSETELTIDRDLPLGDMGKHYELQIEIECRDAREVGIKVACSPDGQEETRIVFSPVNQSLSIDSSDSTLRRDVVYSFHPLDTGGARDPRGDTHPCPITTAPLSHPAFEPLRLRIFVDGPILEVFAGDQLCLTQQIFPMQSESTQIKAFAKGGNARIRSGHLWEMSAASF